MSRIQDKTFNCEKEWKFHFISYRYALNKIGEKIQHSLKESVTKKPRAAIYV